MPVPASPDLLGGQIYVFLLTVLAGNAVGLLYDLFRALRGPGGRRSWRSDLLDLLFWLVAGLLLAVAMTLGNWLEFRLYPLLGAATGIALYFSLASPVILGALLALRRALGRASSRLLRWLGRHALLPLRRALGHLLRATARRLRCARGRRPPGRRLRRLWRRLRRRRR
ncbi:MAG: spore cortex biosynthesis protein YabQ [Bacillota bacterium]|nr:spore cortex biosynthesis protein YabQ [Bacillota bacterium]